MGWIRWVLALYVLALLAVTVSPGDVVRPGHHRHFLSDQREVPPVYLLRDAILNVLAFVPIGLLGRRLAGPSTRALLLTVGAAALLSLGIETLQHFVPWRYSTWIDIVANTAGATVGAVVAGPGLSRRRPRESRWR